jgi:multiple sugar transport system permease protein
MLKSLSRWFSLQMEGGPKNWSPRTRRNLRNALLFISPWILGFLMFNVYPMAASLYYSFTEYHSKAPSEWIGLQNYVTMFQDKLFWKALANTLYMVAIAVPISLFFSFLCAIMLNFKIRGQSVYRVVYFLPSIVPTVASTMLWLWILNPNSGLFNSLLHNLGLEGPNWFRDPNWSKPALLLLALWGTGSTIIIYLSGLQDVSTTLLEAAELDGANWWQRLRNVTIPMVSPITLFTLITGVIAMFQYFAQAYVFSFAVSTATKSIGAPLNSTLFYSVYIYQQGFTFFKMGYASAMAWVLFVIILVCTVLLLRITDRYTYYSG